MSPRTMATLDELEQADWFVRVGVRDTQAVPVLSSWDEAMQHCASDRWDGILLHAMNLFCETLFQTFPERYVHWNTIADQLRPVTIELVRRKSDSMVEKYHLPQVFRDCVQWDILGVLMEAEYADIYPPPGFFAAQAYWYVHGHFPCGWEGEFPKGRRIIY